MATIVIRYTLDCIPFRVPVLHSARMESRGPWYDAPIQANFTLAKRGARVQNVPYASIEHKLVEGLRPILPAHPKGGAPRVPSPQRVRQWEKTRPNFPEQAMKAGLITPGDIHPVVRPYLNGTGPASRSGSASRPRTK